jgi:hypothetical protein
MNDFWFCCFLELFERPLYRSLNGLTGGNTRLWHSAPKGSIQTSFLITKPNIVMKTLRVLLVASVVTASSLLSSIAANACGDEVSTYKGGGYTVLIGEEGSYHGCNSKNQCLEISQYASATQGQYIWENKGTTYSMTPVKTQEGAYRLKVIDARNRVLVSKVVKPVVH